MTVNNKEKRPQFADFFACHDRDWYKELQSIGTDLEVMVTAW